MLKLKALAKINLTLEVLRCRNDGYHEIRSIMQAVSLFDELSFSPYSKVDIKCNMPGWSGTKSLVSRAVSMLQQYCRCDEGVKIVIDKHIPLSSGLGGDSSDAAAVLKGLNTLWNLQLSIEELLPLAVELGSDVSFFLYSGTALAQGRGEQITPLQAFPQTWCVLLFPETKERINKTKQLYEKITEKHFSDGAATDNLVGILSGEEDLLLALNEYGGNKENWREYAFNVFDDIALEYYSGLKDYRQKMIACGAQTVHVAGTGPVLFALLLDREAADGVAACLRTQKMKSLVVSLYSAFD